MSCRLRHDTRAEGWWGGCETVGGGEGVSRERSTDRLPAAEQQSRDQHRRQQDYDQLVSIAAQIWRSVRRIWLTRSSWDYDEIVNRNIITDDTSKSNNGTCRCNNWSVGTCVRKRLHNCLIVWGRIARTPLISWAYSITHLASLSTLRENCCKNTKPTLKSRWV